MIAAAFVFRALLPVDAREPGHTEDAGVALEQPSGESLRFAARARFLVGPDSNKVRSATSRLIYSFMPFCMMIDWVSATALRTRPW